MTNLTALIVVGLEMATACTKSHADQEPHPAFNASAVNLTAGMTQFAGTITLDSRHTRLDITCIIVSILRCSGTEGKNFNSRTLASFYQKHWHALQAMQALLAANVQA